MDAIERNDWLMTRRRLMAILGLVGDTGLTNAELAGRVEELVERLGSPAIAPTPDPADWRRYPAPDGYDPFAP